MVNRNFYVSLLVLVPEPVVMTNLPGPVQLAIHTEMRDVRNGRAFGRTDSAVVERQFNQILVRYEDVLPLERQPGDWKYAQILPILGWVRTNDRLRVLQNLCRRPADDKGDQCGTDTATLKGLAFNTLWTEMAGLAAAFEIVSASVDLPRWSPPRLPETQLAILIDDGESGSRVQLGGVRGLDGADLAATLRVTAKKPLVGAGSDSGGYPLRAEQIALTGSGRDIVLDFPSLGKLSLDPNEIELDVWRVGDRRYFTATAPAERACRIFDEKSYEPNFKEDSIGQQL